jgi:hypothetical protein
MADLDSTLRSPLERLLEGGEQLHGVCVATQQSAFSGHSTAVGVTDDRLLLQPLDRRLQPKGEPLVVRPEDIAAVSAGGAGGGWLNVGSALMDNVAVTLKLRTVDGKKVKLTMMHGSGPLGGLGGGETQRAGVQALGEWFKRAETRR